MRAMGSTIPPGAAGDRELWLQAGEGDTTAFGELFGRHERLMATVRHALMQLPRYEREVVELCMWSGLDQRAAAVALGVSVGTVKSRMHWARRRLAASLGQDRGPSQRPLAPRGAGPHAPEKDA